MYPLQEFIDVVKDKIVSYLPEGKYEISSEVVNKVDHAYRGLKIKKKGDQLELYVNMEDCYEKYCGASSMSDILEGIRDIYMNRPNIEEPTWLKNYENVKDKFFVKVCKYDPKNKLLDQVPYLQMSDLIMTYHILIQQEDREVMSITVKNEMLDIWNVSLKKFRDDAMKSTMALFPPIFDAMERTLGFQTEMISFTNEDFLYGAGVLFYPGTIGKLCELCKGSFVLIPASIHDLIAINVKLVESFDDLNETIEETNEDYCDNGKEALSDYCYVYDKDYGDLETCDEYLKRVKKKSF